MKKKIKPLYKKLIRRSNIIFQFIHILFCLVTYFLPFIFIKILKIWIHVRIGYLESSAIGHFSWPVNVYLEEQKFHKNKKYLDLWFFEKKISNTFLKSTWENYFILLPRNLILPLFYVCQIMPGGKSHIVPYRYYEFNYGLFKINKNSLPYQHFDIYNVTKNKSSYLNFTLPQKRNGDKFLLSYNISKKSKYVCFINRDSSYYKIDTFEKNRNSSINILMPGIQKLTKLGYSGIRMGSVAEEKINFKNSKIIDYPFSNKRTDFLDIYIMSKCKFFISTGTGLDSVAFMFNKPTLIVNYSTFGQVQISPNTLIFMPKLFWSLKKKKLLTFREIFEIGAHLFTGDDQFDYFDLKLIDNDSQVVKETILEMEKRVSGTWINRKEDMELQKKFKDLWPYEKIFASKTKLIPNYSKLKKIPFISTSFLKKYKYLLN